MNKLLKILIIILACVSLTACGDNTNNEKSNEKDNNNNNSNQTEVENENSNSNAEQTLTEKDKMILEIVSLMDEKLAFDVGNYIAGDIPKGEYAFVKFENSGSYYSEKDIAGNIIDNENFDSFGYVKVHAIGNLETQGILINVNALNKLNVSGAKELYEILNDKTDYNQGGMYKIGVDIPAGNYILESIGSGYVAVLSGPISDYEIIDNENFNGKYSISVKNGQFLQINRAIIQK